MTGMKVSKISRKGQVTIPADIRKLLGVEMGDTVTYEVQNGVVTLKRVEPFDAAFHAAVSSTLEEWNSPTDEAAFRDL